MTQIFITKEWGFGKEIWGIVGFHLKGNCQKLIDQSNDGDLLVILGTMDEPTDESDRGRLLGMVKFKREKVDNYEEFISDEELEAPHNYEKNDPKGKFLWPHAVEVIQAWEFVNKPPAKTVIRQKLYQNSASQAVLLENDGDIKAIMNLETRDVPIFKKKGSNKN